MIARMKKVLLIGPKSSSHEVVRVLQQVGTLHLTQTEGSQKSTPDEKLQKELPSQEKLLSKVDSLIAVLPKTEKTQSTHVDSDGEESLLNKLMKQVQDLIQKKQTIQDELSILTTYQGAIKTLAPLLEPLSGSKNFEALGFILIKKDLLRSRQLESELSGQYPGTILFFRRSIDPETYGLVIAFPRNLSNQVRSHLGRQGLNELKMPSSLSSYSLQEAVLKMNERLLEIPNTLETIELELKIISESHRHSLELMKDEIENRISSLKAIKTLGHTQKTFMISGFNPEKDISKLKTTLHERFQDTVHLEVMDCTEAPILFQNRRLVRPFEFFINLLRPPKYGGIDPTPFFALFFPIFFGLIMGDIGYGLVFLSIALFLKFKFKQTKMIQNISEIILICSGYTILFGYIFGECFGDWLEKLGILHPVKMQIGDTLVEWNRMTNLVPLLLLAIGIGVFHVTLGFILKLVQSLRRRHTHEAVEVIAILIALAGLFGLIGVMAQQIPQLARIPSVIAILISIPLLLYMKGPMMILELLSFVGNMLSYARLMAVGVASAYLAFVGNMLGGLVGNIVLGAIIAILFHVINMVLAFSPTIQSARLHYVEFFSKFYETGGSLYQPFAKKRRR